jgi:hypothetical protein
MRKKRRKKVFFFIEEEKKSFAALKKLEHVLKDRKGFRHGRLGALDAAHV